MTDVDEAEVTEITINGRKKLPVVELFGPVIQGEGALCGKVSYFVRFGGCPYRCTWCDSMHAVDPRQIKQGATYMHALEIAEAVKDLNRLETEDTFVTLSGGDPLMWDLDEVCLRLSLEGFKISVETQGSFYKDWIGMVDEFTCSPKPPSSGMNHKVDWRVLAQYERRLGPKLNFKVVIDNQEDLEFAALVTRTFPKTRLYLSVCTPVGDAAADASHHILTVFILEKYRWLTEQVITNKELSKATISPQMHALIYGHQKGR